jgi:acyl carrier protein phosphodiesterase
MNFLAHIFLSGDDEKIMVGNFIADFVKGNQFNKYDEGIQRGILLHREIDHFTDTHAVVKESKNRLREEYGHYAPVIVDIYYDHFLARDFHLFSETPLDELAASFYQMIDKHRDQLPGEVKHMVTYMRRDNWLWHYRTVEGIHKALSGVARRTTFNSGMEKASQTLREDYEAFGREFHRFFPDLMEHSEKVRQAL